jgi:hypothetical protein
MNNASQAMTNPTTPTRLKGVIVQFPATLAGPPEALEPEAEESPGDSPVAPDVRAIAAPGRERRHIFGGEDERFSPDQRAGLPLGENPAGFQQPVLPQAGLKPTRLQSAPPQPTGPQSTGPEHSGSGQPGLQPAGVDGLRDDASRIDQGVAVLSSVPAETRRVERKKSWLERWFSATADPENKRGKAREHTSGLVARFWTGGFSEAHPVRDISPGGIYVVTEERWYLGTQILMTLSMTFDGKSYSERSITVLATAVRWGNDGVGLAFTLRDDKRRRGGQPSHMDGANSQQLDEFMKDFRGLTSAVPVRPAGTGG